MSQFQSGLKGRSDEVRKRLCGLKLSLMIEPVQHFFKILNGAHQACSSRFFSITCQSGLGMLRLGM